MGIKDDPKSTQKQIAKQVGISDSTIERYRNDISMNSLYNRNVDIAASSLREHKTKKNSP